MPRDLRGKYPRTDCNVAQRKDWLESVSHIADCCKAMALRHGCLKRAIPAVDRRENTVIRPVVLVAYSKGVLWLV